MRIQCRIDGDDPILGSHNAAAEHIVGADGCDQQVLGFGLHDGATGGQTIGS